MRASTTIRTALGHWKFGGGGSCRGGISRELLAHARACGEAHGQREDAGEL